MKELLPEGGVRTTWFVNGIKAGVYLSSITLRDGTRVEDPTDLLPAMEPGSAGPAYVEAYQRASEGWLISSTVQSSLVVGGVIALVTALALPDPPGLAPNTWSGRGVLALSGLISAFALSWIPYFVARRFNTVSEEERTSAFHAYPGSLARRLDLEDPEGSPDPSHSSMNFPSDAPLRAALLPR